MRISDWSSDVCSSDLVIARPAVAATARHRRRHDVGDIAIAGLIVRAAIAIGVDIAIGPRLAVRGARPDILGKGARPVAVITRGEKFRAGGERTAVVEFQRRAAHPFVLARSEEHTSELQSLMRISYAVFCLKKTKTTTRQH